MTDLQSSPSPPRPIDLRDPSLYLNRELSWLEFNRRVLHEALDPRTPLLERLKFLAIFSSNLDEFFQVRVAGLKQQVAAGIVERTADGMTPGGPALARSPATVRELVRQHRHCLMHDVLPALADAGRHPASAISAISRGRPGAPRRATSTPTSSRCSRRWRSIRAIPSPTSRT